MIIRDIDNSGYQFRLILVDDLNPEDVAMVQALKARSGESSVVVLERIYAARREAFRIACEETRVDWGDVCDEDTLLDDLMAISSHNDSSALSRRIHKDYFVGYNHKSIGDCGVTTIIVEQVSMLAAKACEHHPLFSGQETSTRAVDMTKAKLVDPIGTSESRAVQQRLMDFYASSWDAVADEVRRRYPRRVERRCEHARRGPALVGKTWCATCDGEVGADGCILGEDEKKYEAAVRYRTFDVLRAWIPAGAATSLSLTMNLRQFGDHLTTLLLHPLAEVREVARAMQAMLRERYPSSGTFGGAAGVSGVGVDGREAERDAWNWKAASHSRGSAYQDMKWDPVGPIEGYLDTLQLDEVLVECDELLASRPRGCLLPHWMSDLGQVSCRFRLDFGSYRDIERQRSVIGRFPVLTTAYGFESWYLDQLPGRLAPDGPRSLWSDAVDLLNDIEHDVRALHSDPTLRQYLIPMGYRVPVSVTCGLPAFVYVVELRSTPQVHPTLRRAVLEHMVRPFRVAHPEVKLHVDESEDPWDLRRGQQDIVKRST